MRLDNVTIRGNNDGGSSSRYACFGLLFPTCQFFGHTFERVETACVDTAVGLLQGTGLNGEQTRISRLYANELRRGYYSNAPQAFAQEFDGWNLVLDAAGVYAEFARMSTPGVGVNFTNCHGTFNQSNLEIMDGTLVRIRRGTGIVQFNGGRLECLSCLFDYDAIDNNGSNCNLDLFVQGMEFTFYKGIELPFVNGWDVEGDVYGTNYGLFVEDCKFGGKDGAEADKTDLVFSTYPVDDIRCVFEKCRFVGLRSFSMQNFKADFVRCFKNDFEKSGGTPFVGPLRQFTQSAGAPDVRTQSLRTGWQDTPWAQTGPRVNILKNADFVDQDFSDEPLPASPINATFAAPWVLESSTSGKIAGFGKWAAFKDATDPDDKRLADLSPSPEAFYMALLEDSKIWQPFDDEDYPVDMSLEGAKICTFQCLCRVKGTLRFALVRCIDDTLDDTVVYDEIVVTSPSAFSQTTLVTLRAQVLATEVVVDPVNDPHPFMAILVQNTETSDPAQWQVFWQQAWNSERIEVEEEVFEYLPEKGLRNTGFVRTPSNSVQTNDFVWAMNALSVKAVGRLQMPGLTPTTTGDRPVQVGWKNPIDANQFDLFDGEIYWDTVQMAVLCRMDSDWYVVCQPQKIAKDPTNNATWHPGDPNHFLYTSATQTGTTLNLDTDPDKVALGTVVRVAWQKTGVVTGNITVDYGGTTDVVLSSNQAAEFVFCKDLDTGNHKWFVTQSNVVTKY